MDTEWQREGRRWVLRFFVDKPGGVGIEDCQRSAGKRATCSTSSGLIEPAYDLEVSSPGLDRELRKERELRWAVGKDVHCWLAGAAGRAHRVRGRLVEVSATG